MNNILKQILIDLRNGSTSKAYEQQSYVNAIAMHLYEKPQLNTEDVEDLKDIITIGNIVYNDTDRELMIIEDGFYDLLLEKYKKYDPNFQVGAEVINFKTSDTVIPASNLDKPIVDGVTFVDIPEDNVFGEDILIDPTKYMDARDFQNVPQFLDVQYISKRTHTVQSEHPELIGTLDKAKFVIDKDAERAGVLNNPNVTTVEKDFFANHIMRGIIDPREPFDIVLELKYDGISVEADCTDEVVSARSRGDTGMGKVADLTPILKGYKFPHREPGCESIGVKFEAIITKTDLPFFNKAKGYEYKNCRSAIVGLFGSSDAWKYRDFITLIPLAVEQRVYETVCECDRVKEIEFLNRYFISKGQPLRYTYGSGTYIENLAWTNLFVQETESMRSLVPFMYDGVVLSYRDERIRRSLGRENYINKFSIAVKFNPLKRFTTYRGFDVTVGKDGTITPMLYFDPVEFYGTIHNKSSGHSLARFNQLALHKGDMLTVEYVNDVMPYVTKPINDVNMANEKVSPLEVFPTVCPICGGPIVISDSGKSAKCTNPNCNGRAIGRMVDMCAKLGLVGFGEATVAQMGYLHLAPMIQELTDSNGLNILMDKGFGPVESENIINQLIALRTNPLYDTVLLGAIGFSGISTKTFEIILPIARYEKLKELNVMPGTLESILSNIKGIGSLTALVIQSEFRKFEKDLDWMFTNANIVEWNPPSGKKVVLSGTRDQELVDFLNTHGFVCDPNASLTKSTDILVIPLEGYTSSKVTKAQSYGIPVVTVNDIMTNYVVYQ